MSHANLTKTQKEIIKAADEFAKGEFDPDLSRNWDRHRCFSRQIWQKCAELGFVGLRCAAAVGGSGMGILETLLVAEAFCRRDPSMGVTMMLPELSVAFLNESADSDVCAQWLQEVTAGRRLIGLPLSDLLPVGRAPATDLCCSVSQDTYVLDGAKPMVTHAADADALVIVVRSPADESATGPLEPLLVETGLSGVRADPVQDSFGLRAAEIADVRFAHVEVPETHRIVRSKAGKKRLTRITGANWLLIAGLSLGLAQGALDRCTSYVKQRNQFGRKIGRFQVIRHKLARITAAVAQARSLAYGVAQRFADRKFNIADAAMAKWMAGEAALTTAYEAIQMHGGYGYMTEYDVERYYREAKALTLIGGTGGHLQDMVADAAIGRIK